MSELQPVLVRIVEWKEWLPGESSILATMQHPQTGQEIAKKVTLHKGVSGFKAAENEQLLELSVTGSGETKEMTYKDEEGKSVTAIYGLYLFQAVLAQNNVEFEEAVKKQADARMEHGDKAVEHAKNKGRNRAEDLIIVQNGQANVPSPQPKKKGR